MRQGTRTGHAADHTARIGRRLGAVCTVAGTTFLVASSGAFAATSPCGSSGVISSAGATETCTYTKTGEDTFTVPTGVSSVHVVAVGGEGAANFNGSTGGFGAQVSADLPVSSSAGFYVEVGGNGGQTNGHVSSGTGAPGGAGGAGGGAAGGRGGVGSGPEGPGGEGGSGGGGATDLRLSPAAAGLSPDTRLVVAGGGGGAGFLGIEEMAALNGGDAGAPGLGNTSDVYDGGGGGAGTASAGGSGGAGGLGMDTVAINGPGDPGVDGALGVGGVGGKGGKAVDEDGPGGQGAGGGGGGYYGGGGGGGGGAVGSSGGGGGGGSSFVVSSATNAVIGTDSTGIPSMTISWTVPNSADLGITVTGPSSAADGTTFTETVKVANPGPAAASDVLTALLIPTGLTATKLDHGTLSGSALHWTRAALADGKSVTYTVTLTVASGAEGTAQILAETASLRTPDPQSANNTASTIISLGSSSAAQAMAAPHYGGVAAPLSRR